MNQCFVQALIVVLCFVFYYSFVSSCKLNSVTSSCLNSKFQRGFPETPGNPFPTPLISVGYCKASHMTLQCGTVFIPFILWQQFHTSINWSPKVSSEKLLQNWNIFPLTAFKQMYNSMYMHLVFFTFLLCWTGR